MAELVVVGLLAVGLAAGLSWRARRRDNLARKGTPRDDRAGSAAPD